MLILCSLSRGFGHIAPSSHNFAGDAYTSGGALRVYTSRGDRVCDIELYSSVSTQGEKVVFSYSARLCDNSIRQNGLDLSISYTPTIATGGLLPLLVFGSGNDVWRCLYQLDQHAFSAQGSLGVSLGMYEGHVVTACAFSDSTGCKPHATGRQPLHARWQRVNPQSDVIQRGHVHPASKRSSENATFRGKCCWQWRISCS